MENSYVVYRSHVIPYKMYAKRDNYDYHKKGYVLISELDVYMFKYI